jgi:hypothetical protein
MFALFIAKRWLNRISGAIAHSVFYGYTLAFESKLDKGYDRNTAMGRQRPVGLFPGHALESFGIARVAASVEFLLSHDDVSVMEPSKTAL